MEEDIFAPKANNPLSAQHFQIIRSLGRGATGEVFLAHALEDGGRPVALKVLENPDAFDDQTLKRFRNEVAVLKKLRHPNLIEAYDFFDYNGCLAFSMEHVDGDDLGHVLKRGRLNADEIDSIILQVLDALHELHINHILHRDMKLENVLLSKTGTVKVGDLGLMKKIDSKGMTRPGLIFGNAQYMAPEYIKKGIYDVRSEIYAVGVMLLELFSGKRRLAEVPENKVMETVIKSRFAIPEDMLEVLPHGYRRIVERALAIDPTQRYQNAIEMRYDIIKNRVKTHNDSVVVIAEDEPPPRVDWSSQPRKPSKLLRSAGVVIMSTIIIFTSYGLSTRKPSFAIQQGDYRGTVRFMPNEFDLLKVSVRKGKINFESRELDCKNDALDLGKRALRCGIGNYLVEFEKTNENHISGFLVRKGHANIFEFKLERTT